MTKLDDVQRQRRNANRHTRRGLSALEASIEEDGWIGAITVAADGEAFDGSARIDVASTVGVDDVQIVESDGSRPVVIRRTDIPSADDPRAIRLGLAANRVAQVNLSWDVALLAELADEVDMSSLWHDAELASLLAGVGDANDPVKEWTGMPEYQQEDQMAAFQARVNFANMDDLLAFETLLGQHVPRNTRAIWYPARERARARDYGYTSDDAT